MALEESARRSRVFIGWWVVAGLFVINMVTSGFGFYAQSPYLRELVDGAGLSTSVASLGTALFFGSSGVTGYFIAGIIARIDVRRVMAAGAIWSGCCLALLGQARTTWQILVVEVLFGMGFAACGLVPVNTLATRWFHRRRSVAISVSATGLSLGGIVVTRQVAVLVDERGLASTTPWFGLLWAVIVVPVVLLVLKPWPHELGVLPDGDPVQAGGSALSRGPAEGMSYRDARRTRFFIFVTLAYVFIMASQVGGLAHQTKLGTDAVSNDVGNLAVSLTAGASVIGRLAGGVVVTRISSRHFCAGLILLQGLSLLVLAQADTRQMFVVGSILFGLSVGNLLMLHPLLLAEAYGVADYPRIYGLSNLFMTLGVALGPVVLGVTEDLADYTVAFSVAGTAGLTAFVLFSAAGPVRQAPLLTPALADSPA